MKKKILFLTMIVAGLLYGCSDKENDPEIITEGEPTYMSVTITFPKAGPVSRATSDPNATDKEVTVQSVDLFIYGGDGDFLAHHAMNLTLFSPGPDDQYQSTEKIKTTTGPKFVYAGINLPASAKEAIKFKPRGQLATNPYIFTKAELTTLSNGLPMFNIKGNVEDFDKDPTSLANQVSINVVRLVSKITVDIADDVNTDGVPGVLSDIQFGVNNFNTRMFLEQGLAPHKDPNWASADYQPTDFVDAAPAEYVPANDLSVNPTPDPDEYNPLYASENTSEEKTKKELTRVTVRAGFLPKEITVSDGPSDYKQETNSETTPKTFYAVTPAVGEIARFFYDQTTAQNFAQAKGGTVLTYNDGHCYWNIYLNKESVYNQWDVLRNEYYKCKITKIAALGGPDPGITDPGNPPASDTEITVDINIEFWTLVSADYILEP